MGTKIKPAFQLREYYPNEVCRIINRKQAFTYMQHGVMPCDIYLSPDTVYVFFKSETQELYEKYKRHEI